MKIPKSARNTRRDHAKSHKVRPKRARGAHKIRDRFKDGFRCFIKRFCYRNESKDNDKLTIDKKSLCLSGHANILLI